MSGLNEPNAKDKMHSLWVEYAPGYSEVVLQDTFMPQVHNEFVNSLKPLVHDKDQVKILDVAAASGQPAFALAAALPNASVIATDLAETFLPLGRAQAEAAGLSDRVTFQQADGEDLSQFADSTFDIVTCSLGLMFFPDESKGLSEFYRVLKPHGILAVTVWGNDVPFFSKSITVAKKITPPESGPVMSPVNIAQRFGDGTGLVESIKKAGFTEVDHRELSVTFKLLKNETLGDWWDQLWKTPFPLKGAVLQAIKCGRENAKEEARKLLEAEFGDWVSPDEGSLTVPGNIYNFIMAKKP